MCTFDPAVHKVFEPGLFFEESDVASEIEIPALSDRRTTPSSAKQQSFCDRCRKSNQNCKHKKIESNEKKPCAKCRSLHRRCEHKDKTEPEAPTTSNGAPKLSSYAPPRTSPRTERRDQEEVNREGFVTVLSRASPRSERGDVEKINQERVVTAPRRASRRIERGDEEETHREKLVTISLAKAIRLAEKNKLIQILVSLCEENRIIADQVIHELLKDSAEERQASNGFGAELASSTDNAKGLHRDIRNVTMDYKSTEKREVVDLIPSEHERTRKRQKAVPGSPITLDVESEPRGWHDLPQKSLNPPASSWKPSVHSNDRTTDR